MQFAPPLVLEILEAQTVLYLPIQRTMGLVGALRVNFTVVQSGAMMTEDFIVLNQSEALFTICMHTMSCHKVVSPKKYTAQFDDLHCNGAHIWK